MNLENSVRSRFRGVYLHFATYRLWPILLLLPVLGCDNAKIAELRKQNDELAAKVDALTRAMPKPSTLDLQEKCAQQVKIFLHEHRWDDPAPRFTIYAIPHYQSALNKCFIDLHADSTQNLRHGAKQDIHSETIYDAFGGNPQFTGKYAEEQESAIYTGLVPIFETAS